MPSSQNSPPQAHHLMRVRVRTCVFQRLQEIAKQETGRSGDHNSVSDLVRAALRDYINVYEATAQLYEERHAGRRKAAN